MTAEAFRSDPPFIADERAMYQGWLDYSRGTLLWKCDGLTDAQLKTAAVAPSNLTLLGLVRHMTEVEGWWFRARAGGQGDVSRYSTDANLDGDFDDVADADASENLAAFRAECAAADAAVAGLGLDHEFASPRVARISLRWAYVHMIEEYNRHLGHADLLREAIDGTTGG